MKAILLAGGQGRRLRSITGNLPKPMVPLVGVPVLDEDALIRIIETGEAPA